MPLSLMTMMLALFYVVATHARDRIRVLGLGL